MPTPRVGQPVPDELARRTVLGSEHVTELSPCLAELRMLEVGVVFVGNGEPRYIEGFVERHGLADKHVDIVTDPTLRAFQAAGLSRSLWATLSPRSIRDQLREIAGGHPLVGIQGDALQQGGSLVVDPDGIVAFHHKSESLGGHARAGDIVDVALRLATARAEARI